MKTHKPIKSDSAGRINLGKAYADRFYSISHEDDRIVLEPARVVSERELRKKDERSARILLNEEEWMRFEQLMEVDEDPVEQLRNLMKEED